MLLVMLTVFSVVSWAQDVKVTSIELNYETGNGTIEVGKSCNIDCDIRPLLATNREVTVTSSMPEVAEAKIKNIATITVTGKQVGESVITVAAQDGSGVTASIAVKVVEATPGGGDDPYNPGGGDDPYNPGGGDDPYNPGGGDDPYNPGGGDDPAGSGIKFASLAEAQQIISQQDEFLNSLNQLDIDARLGKTGGTLDELIEKQKASCLEFTNEEKDIVSNGIMSIMKNLMGMNATAAMPKGEILFVKTTMAEELDAGGYTRGTTIYLGSQILELPESDLKQILAHEFCHVLTRTNPELKEQLYKAIDFKLLTSGASTADVSADVAERWLSNPDVEKLSAYADFTINGNTVPCVMYIYLDNSYQPGNPVFQSMKTGLIALDDNLKPLMKDGKTVVYSTADATDFYTKMGRNTDYVIDPEECIADNFAFLANGITDKPNPEILERIKTALTSVEAKPESMSLFARSSTLYLGDAVQYNVKVQFTPSSIDTPVEYKISDPNVFELGEIEDGIGIFKLKNEGTAEVTFWCTKYPEVTATQTFTVVNPNVAVEKDFTSENISTASLDWNDPQQVTQFVKQHCGVEIPEDYYFVCTPGKPDIKGFFHYECKQMYNGWPVLANELIVHTDANGKMMFMTGMVANIILKETPVGEENVPGGFDQGGYGEGSYAKKNTMSLSKTLAKKSAAGTEEVQLDVTPYYYGKEYLKVPECIGSKDDEGNYILQVPGKVYTVNSTPNLLTAAGIEDVKQLKSVEEMLGVCTNFTSSTPDFANHNDGIKSNLTMAMASMPASVPADVTFTLEVKKCKYADLDIKEASPADTVGNFHPLAKMLNDNSVLNKYLLSAIKKGTQMGVATGVANPEQPTALMFSFDNVQFSTPYREKDVDNDVEEHFYAMVLTCGPDTVAYTSYPLQHCDDQIQIPCVNGTDKIMLATQHTLVSCQPAVTVHWAMQRVLDCYKERFGLDSFDDKGTPVIAYVNDNVKSTQASPGSPSNGSYGLIEIGTGWMSPNIDQNLKIINYGSYPICMAEVVGHEYTHLVARKLGEGEDTDALNESYADILGKMVKRMSLNQHTYASGDDTVEFLSWKLGQEGDSGTPQYVTRRFDDPNLDEQPKFYHGKYWIPNGDEHINNGVQNYWFYLLCTGGTVTPEKGETVTIKAIDRDNAEFITFSALNYFGMNLLTYPLARKHAIFAAKMYFGEDSDELKAVYNAWYAVGVGQDEWQPGMPTAINGINNVNNTTPGTHKMLKNGQLVILKNGIEYNAAGQRMQ